MHHDNQLNIKLNLKHPYQLFPSDQNLPRTQHPRALGPIPPKSQNSSRARKALFSAVEDGEGGLLSIYLYQRATNKHTV